MPEDSDNIISMAELTVEDTETEVSTEVTQEEGDNADIIPRVLSENEENNDQDDDDILADPDFASLPEQNQKGIEKLVNRAKAKEAEIQEKLNNIAPVLEYATRLQDPEQWESALNEIISETRALHGTKTEPTGESRYGLAYETDDRILEKAVEQAVAKVTKDLDPYLKRVGTILQQDKAVEKASSLVGPLKAEYGDWVTEDLVKEAILKKPGLDANDAFKIVHFDKGLRHFAQYGESRAKKPARDMITSQRTDRTESPQDWRNHRLVSMSELSE